MVGNIIFVSLSGTTRYASIPNMTFIGLGILSARIGIELSIIEKVKDFKDEGITCAPYPQLVVQN